MSLAMTRTLSPRVILAIQEWGWSCCVHTGAEPLLIVVSPRSEPASPAPLATGDCCSSAIESGSG